MYLGFRKLKTNFFQLLDSTALVQTGSASSTASSSGGRRRKLASIVVVITGIVLCIFAPEDLNFVTAPGVGSPVTLSPYLALIVHVTCGLALALHSRIADARFWFLIDFRI
jgi:hypothetical protein